MASTVRAQTTERMVKWSAGEALLVRRRTHMLRLLPAQNAICWRVDADFVGASL